MERDGHVRRELMIPGSIGPTVQMDLNNAAFVPVVNPRVSMFVCTQFYAYSVIPYQF